MIYVVRMLVYTYADDETADQDMRCWQVQGTSQFGDKKRVESTVIDRGEKGPGPAPVPT